MKIDVHQHVLPPVYVEALNASGISTAGGIPLPGWSPDAALEMMDRQGIGTAVLSVSSPGVHFGNDAAARALARACNEYTARLVGDHPGRFGGFAVLPMPDVEGSLAELTWALDTLALDGVVLMTSHADGRYLGDGSLDPVLEELNRRSAVAFVHPTLPPSPSSSVTIPGFATEFVFDTSRAIANLVWTGAAERFPHIRFIFAHAGGTAPYLAWRWALLDTSPQMRERAPRGFLHYLRGFHYDTALSGSEFALAALTKLVGAERILYGSDYPFAPEAVGAASAKGLERFEGLGDEDRLAIGSGNAERLLGRR
ncbi:MAG: amidohydrolase family protein [Pseudomonadales bacterium]